MTHTLTHTFDIVWDCPIQDFLKMLDQYNLKIESYDTFGPAGGNPEITVSGSPEDIQMLSEDLL